MTRHSRFTTLAAAILTASVAGCGTPDEPAAQVRPTPAPSTTADTPAPSDTSAAPAATRTPGDAVTVVEGLDLPWGAAALPDGSMLVSLRDEARVVSVSTDGTVTEIPGTGEGGRVAGVRPDGEGGLLGLAVAPETTDTEGWVYAYVTAAEDNRVVRMPLEGGRLGSQQEVVTGIPKASFHNGGQVAFGPDGMLYVSTGDAGRTQASQQIDDLGGKILRVRPDGGIPEDNPTPGSPVWSLGHRNVQGLGWAADGTMYASEFGQDTFDELNRIVAGGNYGWPEVEGPGDGGGEFVAPIATWATDDASPSGIAVTEDAVYLAALRGQRLWRVPVSPSGGVGEPAAFYQGEFGRLRTVTTTESGLRLATSNGDGTDRLIDVALS